MGKIVMFTTSIQNSRLSPYARIMFLAHSIIILFACFVAIFCCGEYGALAYHWTSHSPKKALNFLNTNSQIHFTIMRFWFSSLFCSPLKCLVFFEFVKHFSFNLQKINTFFFKKIPMNVRNYCASPCDHVVFISPHTYICTHPQSLKAFIVPSLRMVFDVFFPCVFYTWCKGASFMFMPFTILSNSLRLTILAFMSKDNTIIWQPCHFY